MPDLKARLATFLVEHLHTDEEIRFFVAGSGYFDVRHGRQAGEPFIRIHGKAGDLIILVHTTRYRYHDIDDTDDNERMNINVSSQQVSTTGSYLMRICIFM